MWPWVAWPPAAIILVGLLGVRALQGVPRPGEGTLTANGFLLSRTGVELPAPAFSPDGVGALLVAVYATLTRAFDRHETLVAAGRELFLVFAVVSALLLWATARRLSLGHAAAAAAILLGTVPQLISPLALIDIPAQLAVPWLLAAGWLVAPGRPTPTARLLALLALAVAVVLAPGVLLLVLSGVAAGVLIGPLPVDVNRWVRLAVAGLFVAAFAVTALLPAQWSGNGDPRPAGVPGQGALPAIAAVCAVAAALTVWRLPRLRVPAIAVLGTTAASAAGMFASPWVWVGTVLVCVPAAALLTAALLEDLLRVAARRPARAGARRGPVVAAGLGAAAALVAAGFAAAVVLPATRAQEGPSAGAAAALRSWVAEQLPEDAQLVAPASIWAELVHAGLSEDRVRLPGTTGNEDPFTPVLTVTDGPASEGFRTVARFDGPGSTGPLLVLDPSPGTPTPPELQLRRSLAAALLANPGTATADPAAEVLHSADVDQRLLSLLAAAAARGGIGVVAFPTIPGEPDPLARRALLATLDGQPLRAGAPVTDALVAWLRAQLPPFAPDTVEVTDAGVLIGFRYVSDPDALVSRSAR